jgi:acetyl-CoA carboxylase biotin carboxyl carrier protein
MSIIDKVKQLISIMNENDLSEIEIQEDITRVRIKKSEAKFTHMVSTAPVPLPHPVKLEHERLPYAEQKECEGFAEIVSPMVGTFYRASAPGADPCVNIGDHVNEEKVVCIIEAMKIMNEVKAEMDGEIVEIYVSDGKAVEYGQPLFRVKSSQK